MELLALIGSCYASLRPRFDPGDTRAVFGWVEAFCRNPWSDDDAANAALQVVVGMPPVQKAALGMLPALAPTHAPEVRGEGRRGVAAAAVLPGSRLPMCPSEWVWSSLGGQQQQQLLRLGLPSRSRRPPPRHPPAPPAQLWPEHVWLIARLLKPQHVVEHWRAQQAQQQALPQQEGEPAPAAAVAAQPGAAQNAPQHKFALNSAFLQKARNGGRGGGSIRRQQARRGTPATGLRRRPSAAVRCSAGGA